MTDAIAPSKPARPARIRAAIRGLPFRVRRRFMKPVEFLQWRIDKEHRFYDALISAAAARGDADEVESLRSEASFEVGLLISDRDAAVTRAHLSDADRLFIAVPERPEHSEEEEGNEHWRWDSNLQRWLLTPKGLTVVRAAIRAELKERRDSGASRLTLSIGLVGGGIGLVNAVSALLKVIFERG